MKRNVYLTYKYVPFLFGLYFIIIIHKETKSKLFERGIIAMCRIRYIFSGVLVAIITALFSGCGPWAYKTKFPEKVGKHLALYYLSLREVCSAVMTYLVLNPDWTVPPTILNNDIIPAMIKNPAYLTEKNLKILGIDGTEVNPSSVDWNSIKTNGFPFRVHQAPGPDNALGRIKFMFPNNYSVYIHDTPNHNLFERTDRSFSSGCIRVNNPQELAAWLMQDNPEWGLVQIKEVIEQGKGRIVNLPNPVQVHILYLTAWASDDKVFIYI